MSGTVLLVNGSVRNAGNTDTLVNRIFEGSASVGIDAKLVELKKKDIRNCIGCYRCVEDSTCSLHDDMEAIRNDIEQAELLLFASPLYWWSVTGLMKTFIDRLFYYYYAHNRNRISGKKAIVIIPMAENNVESVADLIIKFYERLSNRLEVNIVEIRFFSGLMGKQDLIKRPGYLDEAYTIGTSLSKWVNIKGS